MNKLLPAFFALLMTVSGGSLFAQTDSTVVDIIAAADTLSTLETLLDEADLIDALNGEGPFTVFAPSNAAFALLSEEDLAYFTSEDGADSLATVLQYHVVADSLPADSLFTGMVASLTGDSLMIDTTGMMVTVNGVMVTMADVIASNGVIHVINAVLLPSMMMEEDSSTNVRQEPAFAREVTIAPNPAISYFTIGLPTNILGTATLTLRDLNGRVVSTQRATSDQHRIDVASLPNGAYLLEVRASEGAIQRRVMVQR